MVRVWIPDPDAKGGRRLGWFGSFDTRAEASVAEAKATLKITRPQGQHSWRIAQFYERWLLRYHGPNTRRGDKTLKHNQDAMRAFIKDYGHKRLDDYGRNDARDYAAEFPWRARVVSAFFADAVRDGKLDASPFAGMSIKRAKGRQHIDPLTMQEVERLASIAENLLGWYGPHFAAFIRVAGWTGMRPGELCRLEWRDVLWSQNEIDIRRTKTETDRTIALAENVNAELHRLPRLFDQVFHTAYDKPMGQSSYGYSWRQVRAVFENEVPRDHWLASRLRRNPKDHLSFYEFRHACGSHLASLGLSVWDISEHLGNSARVCETIYVHPYKSAVRDRVRAALNASVDTQVEPSEVRDAR